jgi:hypothetical protein
VRRPDRWQAGWLVLVALAQSFMGLAEAGSAQVVLPCACQTSAGIFDSAGRLIRTLWSGKAYPAGPVAIDWDGRDDDGSPAAGAQRYRVRVLAHNVRYVWEGVIGNTSAQFAGPHVYRAANPINGMAIDARGDAFYVVGYNEQQSALHRFSTLDPQSPTALAHDDYRRVFKYAATDGTLAYFLSDARRGDLRHRSQGERWLGIPVRAGACGIPRSELAGVEPLEQRRRLS